MNKSELITDISKRTGHTQKQSEEFLGAFVESVEEAVAKDDKVLLVGFGNFQKVFREKKAGKHPKTGEDIIIPARNVPVFHPGKEFKDIVK